jgi:cellulose synthase/poly-beta-1,6-N-acetylglucosamine synthase-like glycosyltransferase
MLQVLFWLSVGAGVAVFAVYPALLRLLAPRATVGTAPPAADKAPSVDMVIAARNEEKILREKLENALASDYPGALRVIVGDDGSTDETASIARAFSDRGVVLVSSATHGGKAAVQNRCLAAAVGEIVILSDAPSLYETDAVSRLAARFADPKVGCVVGQVIYGNRKVSSVAASEGAYWRYETAMRRGESAAGTLCMGSGSIIAFRRGLFAPLDPSTSDDFVIPLRCALLGYKTVFEERAVSRETVATETTEEFRSKARIVALDSRGLLRHWPLLLPWHRPPVWLSLWPHKVLRWLVPLYAAGALLSAAALAPSSRFFAAMSAAQILFWLAGAGGWLLQRRGMRAGPLAIPAYLLIVSLASAAGLARMLFGSVSPRWEPAR